MSLVSFPELWGPCVVRVSVHDAGREEADRHKWIESEKVGFDLGEPAIRQWVRNHWNGFLRARWLEHIYGRTFWIELDRDDHGLLCRAFQGSALVGPIVDHILLGSENLDIILEARVRRWPMDEVLTILEALDINSRRLEFIVENRLVHG